VRTRAHLRAAWVFALSHQLTTSPASYSFSWPPQMATCAAFWGCHCLPERVLWRICVAGILFSTAQSILGLIFGSLPWVVVSAVGVASAATHSWALAARKASVVKHLPGHFVAQHIASIAAINLFKDVAGITINSICLSSAVLSTYAAARLYVLWTSPPRAPVSTTIPHTEGGETAPPASRDTGSQAV
jgi:hypothetical protein